MTIGAACESRSLAVTVADPARRDCPLVYVNEAFQTLTGYSRDDAIGRNCRFLQGEDTSPDARDKLRFGIQRRRPVSARLTNYTCDGRPFTCMVFINPILLEDEHPALIGCHFKLNRAATDVPKRLYRAGIGLETKADGLAGDQRTMIEDALRMRSSTLMQMIRRGVPSVKVHSLHT